MDLGINRRDFLALGAAAGAYAAVSPLRSTHAAPAKKGGTVKVGINQVLENIDPRSRDAGLYNWLQLVALTMYEPPVKYGNGGKVIPLLAESWDISDPKRTVLTVRKGVEFHNGQPLTVDDMVASIRNIHARGAGLPPDVFDSVDKLDASRLVIRTKIPYRTLDNMRWWWILPANPPGSLAAMTASAGTGPFKLSAFVKGTSISVVRNPHYWGAPRPYLDGLSFLFLSDPSVLIANFLSGSVDYLHDIPNNLLSRVSGQSGSKTLQVGYFFHWWHPQMRTAPLNDLRVRQALRYAMDRKTMNTVAWGGKGLQTINPFDVLPVGIHQDAQFDVPYDPERAASLLKQAGASGAQVPINVLSVSEQGKLEAQVMQQGFQKAGLQAPISLVDPNQWETILYTKDSHTGLINNYGTLPFPLINIAGYMLNPSINPMPPKPSPVPQVYAAFRAAQNAIDDKTYNQRLKDLQRLYLKYVATYLSFIAPNFQIAPQNLNGVEATAFGDVRFDNASFA